MVAAQSSPTRTTIQISIPDWQKTEWEDHATDLDMSLSEFVRSMVQAGRNGYSRAEDPEPTNDPPIVSDDRSTESKEIHDQLYEYIAEHQPVSWDDILAVLTSDIEQNADSAIHALENEGQIRHSGPQGGYIVLE